MFDSATLFWSLGAAPPEILLAPSSLEDVVALRAEDHDALVEVVVLHGGGGVEDGERRVHLGLEGVVGAAVVQVVAQARHQQPEDLQQRGTFQTASISKGRRDSVAFGCKDVAQLLLEEGADPNKVDSIGFTYLNHGVGNPFSPL